MAGKTTIEWATDSWNPVRGCSLVSPGCTNCYAMRQAHRSSGIGGAYDGLTKISKGGPVWTGKVSLHRELLDWPLRRRKPSRIFVNSMSDLFHPDVSWEFIDAVFGVMAMTQRHSYQILTKRPARMLDYFQRLKLDPLFRFPVRISDRAAEFIGKGHDNCGPSWPLQNVWLGVSVEDQVRADERIPLLLQTPAAVRWISAEPLLSQVKLRGEWLKCPGGAEYGRGFNRTAVHAGCCEQHPRLQWVVAGGESGPGARPFRPEWGRSIVRQCRAAGVPVFIKQMGSYIIDRNDAGFDGCEPGSWPLRQDGCDPEVEHEIHGFIENYQGADCRIRLIHRKGGDPAEWPEDLRVRKYPA